MSDLLQIAVALAVMLPVGLLFAGLGRGRGA